MTSSTYRRGYACGVLGCKPRIQRHLNGLASQAGEKSGLEACRYYAEIEAKLGAAFVRSVETAIDRIVLHPTAWREVEEDVRRHLLKRFPYGIHYTIEEGFVLIVSVAHVKRGPGYWRKRLL